MDSTSQVLMPHRSDGLVGYHSYSLKSERMGIGLSVHPPQVWMLLLSSRLLYGNTMVLYGFIMLYHVSFVLQFWWSNTLLSGTIQMSGHQIRSNLTAWWSHEICWNRDPHTSHPCSVCFHPKPGVGNIVWLFRRRRKAQRERLGPPQGGGTDIVWKHLGVSTLKWGHPNVIIHW